MKWKRISIYWILLWTVCLFSGCSAEDEVDMFRDVWGMNSVEASAVFQVSLDEAEYTEIVVGSRSIRYYAFEDYTISDVACCLTLGFIAYGEADPIIQEIRLVPKSETQNFSQLAHAIQSDDAYLRLDNGKEGFFGLDQLSEDNIDWLSENTLFDAGTIGIQMEQIRIEDGVSVGTGEYDPEIPLVSAIISARTIRLVDNCLYLMSQKDAYTAFASDVYQ